jgi:hypothetical protein
MIVDGTIASVLRWQIGGVRKWSWYVDGTNTFKADYNGADKFAIDSTGNVGIGTTNPGEKLEVAGNIKVSGSATIGNFNFFGTNCASIGGIVCGSSMLTVLGSFSASTSSFPYGIWDALGNVGIGTTNPTAKLEVAGDLKVSGSYITIPYTEDQPPPEDCDVNTRGRMVVFGDSLLVCGESGWVKK